MLMSMLSNVFIFSNIAYKGNNNDLCTFLDVAWYIYLQNVQSTIDTNHLLHTDSYSDAIAIVIIVSN